MTRWFLPLSMGFILAGCGPSDDASNPPSDMFTKTIRPIFQKHCGECHDGWMAEAALRTDSLSKLIEGGRSGPGIIPGNPEKGTIMMSMLPRETGQRLYDNYGHDFRLSTDEMELIREWIRQGAN